MLSAGDSEHCTQANDPVLHEEEQMTMKQRVRVPTATVVDIVAAVITLTM